MDYEKHRKLEAYGYQSVAARYHREALAALDAANAEICRLIDLIENRWGYPDDASSRQYLVAKAKAVLPENKKAG